MSHVVSFEDEGRYEEAKEHGQDIVSDGEQEEELESKG